MPGALFRGWNFLLARSERLPVKFSANLCGGGVNGYHRHRFGGVPGRGLLHRLPDTSAGRDHSDGGLWARLLGNLHLLGDSGAESDAGRVEGDCRTGWGFQDLQFTPGQPVVESEAPWSADVMGYRYDWPAFVMSEAGTGGYQQMVVDSLARAHLAFTFVTGDLKLVTLYVREYPNGQGPEWQVERIEEPGVAFLMMDSKARAYVFMVNNEAAHGPEGIKLLTRQCVEYLPVEE